MTLNIKTLEDAYIAKDLINTFIKSLERKNEVKQDIKVNTSKLNDNELKNDVKSNVIDNEVKTAVNKPKLDDNEVKNEVKSNVTGNEVKYAIHNPKNFNSITKMLRYYTDLSIFNKNDVINFRKEIMNIAIKYGAKSKKIAHIDLNYLNDANEELINYISTNLVGKEINDTGK
jgi:hypothetical protein